MRSLSEISVYRMDSSLHAIQNDLQWLAVKETEMLQGPDVLTTNSADLAQPFPRAFMLNHEGATPPPPALQGQAAVQKVLSQNGFFANTAEYTATAGGGSVDGRANYNTLPNKNFVDYNYADNFSPHHHLSLLPTVSKSPLPPPSAAQQMMPPNYENEAYYMYQMQPQHQSMHLPPSHPAPNFKYNYHSINMVDNDLRQNNFDMQMEDKDKLRMHHQGRNEQFYLHKPNESVPMQTATAATAAAAAAAFQFQTPSAYGTSASTMTSFNQRKTWESSSSSSPIHSPPHIFTPPR